MAHPKKSVPNRKKHPTRNQIVSDGNIGGKKVTTPRTRRPAPPKPKNN